MRPPKNWTEISTGGNCTGWQRILTKVGGYAFITQAGDPIAPTRLRRERVILGIYGGDDERQLCAMEFSNAADAVAVAKRISFIAEVEV
jgi:hypothetical protein